ncbi:hypothetical protein ACF1GS_18225 [Streptomyces eurythermus]|uniref:hypothetical protein n=1 Tax=Streptomyces eurythermus TaxID=42237 RepID=UPI003701A20A
MSILIRLTCPSTTPELQGQGEAGDDGVEPVGQALALALGEHGREGANVPGEGVKFGAVRPDSLELDLLGLGEGVRMAEDPSGDGSGRGRPGGHGAGSAGVTVVTALAEAAPAAVAVRSAHPTDAGEGHAGIVVQAYAAGTEYSVESVTQNGTTTHLALTRKATTSGPCRVETGDSLPVCLPRRPKQPSTRR